MKNRNKMVPVDEYIAIDMGGTKVHVARLLEGRILAEIKFATAEYNSKEALIKTLVAAIKSFYSEQVKGIGIGVPGLVDTENGVVFDVQNIRNWKEVPLKAALQAHFRVEVSIANDANLFAYGESVLGAAKDCNNMLGISLGTGIGLGIIVNNQLHSGTFSGAGEIGSIPYLDKTVEDYCSGKFFQYQHQKDGAHFAKLADQQDKQALELFEEFGTHLGKLIKTLLLIFAPECIVLGGSISKAYPHFQAAMHKEVSVFPFSKIIDRLEITPSQLDNAALLGAALLAQEKYEFNKKLAV